MSAPAHYRAYKFYTVSSPTNAAALTTSLDMLRNLLNAVLGGGSWTDANGSSTTAPTGWTCLGSSDGSAGGMDGVNRWASSIPSGSTGLPWIVIGHATLGAILIRKSAATGVAWAGTGSVTMFHAVSYSGGSATTVPAGTKERALFSGSSWGNPATNVASRIHVIESATSLQWIIARNGSTVGFLKISTFRDSYLDTSVWPRQIAGQVSGVNTSAPSADDAQAADMVGVNLADTAIDTLAGNSFGDLGVAAGPGLDNKYIWRPRLYSSSAASAQGPRAWGIDEYDVVAAANHLGFPSDAAPEWVALGGRAIPWNKTTLLLTA